jgi:hypothetical protein
VTNAAYQPLRETHAPLFLRETLCAGNRMGHGFLRERQLPGTRLMKYKSGFNMQLSKQRLN